MSQSRSRAQHVLAAPPAPHTAPVTSPWAPALAGAPGLPRRGAAGKCGSCLRRLLGMEGLEGRTSSSSPAASYLHCLHPDPPLGALWCREQYLKKLQVNIKTNHAKLVSPHSQVEHDQTSSEIIGFLAATLAGKTSCK